MGRLEEHWKEYSEVSEIIEDVLREYEDSKNVIGGGDVLSKADLEFYQLNDLLKDVNGRITMGVALCEVQDITSELDNTFDFEVKDTGKNINKIIESYKDLRVELINELNTINYFVSRVKSDRPENVKTIVDAFMTEYNEKNIDKSWGKYAKIPEYPAELSEDDLKFAIEINENISENQIINNQEGVCLQNKELVNYFVKDYINEYKRDLESYEEIIKLHKDNISANIKILDRNGCKEPNENSSIYPIYNIDYLIKKRDIKVDHANNIVKKLKNKISNFEKCILNRGEIIGEYPNEYKKRKGEVEDLKSSLEEVINDFGEFNYKLDKIKIDYATPKFDDFFTDNKYVNISEMELHSEIRQMNGSPYVGNDLEEVIRNDRFRNCGQPRKM
ncbi:MAG: hypothetical protein K6D38_02265 [Pseudobutyrivibrio sp.]|nr:hypothetical protein [Pseudobutyrivibrio sp.]